MPLPLLLAAAQVAPLVCCAPRLALLRQLPEQRLAPLTPLTPRVQKLVCWLAALCCW
jgi:hypothetical protein